MRWDSGAGAALQLGFARCPVLISCLLLSGEKPERCQPPPQLCLAFPEVMLAQNSGAVRVSLRGAAPAPPCARGVLMLSASPAPSESWVLFPPCCPKTLSVALLLGVQVWVMLLEGMLLVHL